MQELIHLSAPSLGFLCKYMESGGMFMEVAAILFIIQKLLLAGFISHNSTTIPDGLEHTHEGYYLSYVYQDCYLIEIYDINAGAYPIGVNYGLNGDNLPPPQQVIDLYGRCHINFIRLFEPRHEVLEALRGKPFLVSLGTRNEDIQSIASNQAGADGWVNTNVVPFINDVNIGYITVGNEVIPAGAEAPYVGQAITNILKSLNNFGITKDIKVTTVLPATALASSYPPSAGAFTSEAAGVLKDIAQNLWHRGSQIMVNVYPYFAYAGDPAHISLDYALFQSKEPVVIDGPHLYYNLFDAMMDAFYAAFEKIGAPNVSLAISETGWPSGGNAPYTSIENAQNYNKNLMDHVLGGKGTPRRPGQIFDAFFFEMFNEDLKSAGVEQNFGFFQPNMQPVYQFWPC